MFSVRTYDYGLNPLDRELPLIMAQIETIEGVKNVSGISRVDGIDALFVGPADLQFDLKNRPDVAPGDYGQCLAAVIAPAKAAGKAAGILVRNLDDLPELRALGFTHIAVDSDLSILRKGYQHILSQFAR